MVYQFVVFFLRNQLFPIHSFQFVLWALQNQLNMYQNISTINFGMLVRLVGYWSLQTG